MKQVINESLQSLQILFLTNRGPVMYRLTPGESIVVPEAYISNMVKKLQRRKMIKVNNY